MNNGNMYLLKDDYDFYYLWNSWDGHLLKVSDEFANEDDIDDGYPPDGLDGVEKVVSNIIGNMYWVLKDSVAVFRTN